MAIQKIIILGIGGNCVDILDTIRDLDECGSRPGYECVGFLDDNPDRWGKHVAGVKVLGPLEAAGEYGDASFVNGIGSPRNFWRKEDIIARTGIEDERFATIVHPSASVSRMAALGPGAVVLQNVTITVHARVGKHVIVLPNTVISHDAVVGDYCCITGGVCVSGDVTIGRACYLGTNSTVRNGVRIGDYSQVGMGSVVLDDVPARSVFVGNPARLLRYIQTAIA